MSDEILIIKNELKELEEEKNKQKIIEKLYAILLKLEQIRKSCFKSLTYGEYQKIREDINNELNKLAKKNKIFDEVINGEDFEKYKIKMGYNREK